MYNIFEMTISLYIIGLILSWHFFNKLPVKKKKKSGSARLVELIQEFFKNLVKLAMKGPRDLSRLLLTIIPKFIKKIIFFSFFCFFKLVWYVLGFVFLSFYCCFYWGTFCCGRLYLFIKSSLFLVFFLPKKIKQIYLDCTWKTLWNYYWDWSWLTFIQKFRLLVFFYVKTIWLITYFIYFINYFCYIIYYLFCTFIIYTQSYLTSECLKLKYSTLDMLIFWGIIRDLLKNVQRAYFVFYLEFLTFFENLLLYPKKKKYFSRIFFWKLFKFIQQLKYQLLHQKLKLIKNFIYFDQWIGYYIRIFFNNKNDYF